MRRGLRPLLACVLCLLSLASCEAGASTEGGELRIEEAWARPVLAAPAAASAEEGHDHAHGAAGNSVVYLTVHNPTPAPDRLLGGETGMARTVELHRSQVAEGVMRMRHLPEGVSVPAGGALELRPGDYHLMLIDLHQPLTPGERFPLTLHFERAGTREVEVEVRAP